MKFTIEVTMQDRWIPHFLGMLSTMERFGSIGHSGTISFYSDGDGDYRPKFSWDESLPKPCEPVQDDPDLFFDAG